MFSFRQGTYTPAMRKCADKIDHQQESGNNDSQLRPPLVKTETAENSLFLQVLHCFTKLLRDIHLLELIVIFKSQMKEVLL